MPETEATRRRPATPSAGTDDPPIPSRGPSVPPSRGEPLTAAAVRGHLARLIDADGRGRSAVARAAGMAPQQLHKILAGVNPDPRVGTVGRILAALGLGWDALETPEGPTARPTSPGGRRAPAGPSAPTGH